MAKSPTSLPEEEPVEIIAAAPSTDENAEVIKPGSLPAEAPQVTDEEDSAGTIVLTAEELADIEAEALKQFTQGRKKALREKAIKEALRTLRRTHGDPVLGVMGEMCSIIIDLPENSDGIIWNQVKYFNGDKFTGPRHVVAGFLDTMWAGQMAEHNLSGKKRAEFYRKQRPVMVTKSDARIVEDQGLRIG